MRAQCWSGAEHAALSYSSHHEYAVLVGQLLVEHIKTLPARLSQTLFRWCVPDSAGYSIEAVQLFRFVG